LAGLLASASPVEDVALPPLAAASKVETASIVMAARASTQLVLET
jgi:hypothetical protein